MPADHLLPHRTADGSFTLCHAQAGEPYHSLHGAVTESTHVFIRAGLEHAVEHRVDVLEVGLGTGLNLLLTWIRCLEGKCEVRYTALEPYPLEEAVLHRLAHAQDLGWPGLHGAFIRMMTGPMGEGQEAEGGLEFTRSSTAVQDLQAREAFDVVYFDAFAPNSAPHMWTLDVFRRMWDCLRPSGILVTYCAKGEVRRTMQAAGFVVERLPGPPGKREMLRATKPFPWGANIQHLDFPTLRPC